MHHYVNAMRQYAVFSGRASRAQYWYFQLVFLVILIVALILDVATENAESDPLGAFLTLAILVHLLPALAITARRLHDTDRSGWFILIGYIPVIGQIMLLIFMTEPSKPGRYTFDTVMRLEPAAQFAPSEPPTSTIALDQLEKIAALHASGAIDEAEFKQLKANILTRSSR